MEHYSKYCKILKLKNSTDQETKQIGTKLIHVHSASKSYLAQTYLLPHKAITAALPHCTANEIRWTTLRTYLYSGSTKTFISYYIRS